MGAEAPRILEEEATKGETSIRTQNQTLSNIDTAEKTGLDKLPRI